MINASYLNGIDENNKIAFIELKYSCNILLGSMFDSMSFQDEITQINNDEQNLENNHVNNLMDIESKINDYESTNLSTINHDRIFNQKNKQINIFDGISKETFNKIDKIRDKEIRIKSKLKHWLFNSDNNTNNITINNEENELHKMLINTDLVIISDFDCLICWPYIIHKYGNVIDKGKINFNKSLSKLNLEFDNKLINSESQKLLNMDINILKEVKFITTEPISNMARFYLKEFYKDFNNKFGIQIEENILSNFIENLFSNTCCYGKYINVQLNLKLQFISSGYSLGSFNILIYYFDYIVMILLKSSIISKRYTKPIYLPNYIHSENNNQSINSKFKFADESDPLTKFYSYLDKKIDLLICLDNSFTNDNISKSGDSIEKFNNQVLSIISFINKYACKSSLEDKLIYNTSYNSVLLKLKLLSLLDLTEYIKENVNSSIRIMLINSFYKIFTEISSNFQSYLNDHLHNRIYKFTNSFSFDELLGKSDINENRRNYNSSFNDLSKSLSQRMFICQASELKKVLGNQRDMPNLFVTDSFINQILNDEFVKNNNSIINANETTYISLNKLKNEFNFSLDPRITVSELFEFLIPRINSKYTLILAQKNKNLNLNQNENEKVFEKVFDKISKCDSTIKVYYDELSYNFCDNYNDLKLKDVLLLPNKEEIINYEVLEENQVLIISSDKKFFEDKLIDYKNLDNQKDNKMDLESINERENDEEDNKLIFCLQIMNDLRITLEEKEFKVLKSNQSEDVLSLEILFINKLSTVILNIESISFEILTDDVNTCKLINSLIMSIV